MDYPGPGAVSQINSLFTASGVLCLLGFIAQGSEGSALLGIEELMRGYPDLLSLKGSDRPCVPLGTSALGKRLAHDAHQHVAFLLCSFLRDRKISLVPSDCSIL